MSRPTFALKITTAIAVVFLASSALHAQDAGKSHGTEAPMTGPGMGNMTGQMGQMMDHCSQMMGGGSSKPNEQWRDGAPPASGKTDKEQ